MNDVMKDIRNTAEQKEFWELRYKNQTTGWDIGYPSIPIQTYCDQLEDRSLKILIPGAGNAYEAEYLHNAGFTHVSVLDLADAPLKALGQRVPTFPKEHLFQENFFTHSGQYDLILEQTFFCSIIPSPENRKAYAQKMSDLLASNGKLVGLWFDIPLTGNLEKRPFGGTKDEYLNYLTPFFKVETFEPCYNSIEPRMGSELFGIFRKSSER